jgi:transposase
LLVPLADAITERSRASWHMNADETTWRVLALGEGDGPAKWWLWVFTGPETPHDRTPARRGPRTGHADY